MQADPGEGTRSVRIRIKSPAFKEENIIEGFQSIGNRALRIDPPKVASDGWTQWFVHLEHPIVIQSLNPRTIFAGFSSCNIKITPAFRNSTVVLFNETNQPLHLQAISRLPNVNLASVYHNGTHTRCLLFFLKREQAQHFYYKVQFSCRMTAHNMLEWMESLDTLKLHSLYEWIDDNNVSSVQSHFPWLTTEYLFNVSLLSEWKKRDPDSSPEVVMTWLRLIQHCLPLSVNYVTLQDPQPCIHFHIISPSYPERLTTINQEVPRTFLEANLDTLRANLRTLFANLLSTGPQKQPQSTFDVKMSINDSPASHDPLSPSAPSQPRGRHILPYGTVTARVPSDLDMLLDILTKQSYRATLTVAGTIYTVEPFFQFFLSSPSSQPLPVPPTSPQSPLLTSPCPPSSVPLPFSPPSLSYSPASQLASPPLSADASAFIPSTVPSAASPASLPVQSSTHTSTLPPSSLPPIPQLPSTYQSKDTSPSTQRRSPNQASLCFAPLPRSCTRSTFVTAFISVFGKEYESETFTFVSDDSDPLGETIKVYVSMPSRAVAEELQASHPCFTVNSATCTVTVC